ncbi:hypothetical protein [Synechococcus sp. LTW-R]|uniref:hypothetical protein n=1 Tax=Synechococcus sp. LTW-R TaxID=2751170 RepID=UPI001624DD9B|nr:hypothetical protein [Synechococcus sp. LTW-R]QNG29173.1 hypothetical protein H0O22_10610 [Synechococcus sp. LTW-R]
MSSASEGRYGAIERAYGEGRFSDALEQTEALLTELQGPEATAETQAVLGRLQLLTGHIHLYGLGQPDEALAYYQAVARSAAPTTLVDLAQAGLKRCEEQPAASAAPAANSEDSSPVRPEGLDLPATPWLSQLSEPQEALTALQAAWREVPASPPAATPLPGEGTPATPWGTVTAADEASSASEAETPADHSITEGPDEDTSETKQEPALPAEVELVDEQDSSSPGPDYSLGNLVVELAPSPDKPPSENRPQQPQERGQSWRRLFKLKRP